MISVSRADFTASGTSSGIWRWAKVPGRSEYLNMKALSYPTSRISESVASCSSAVSPEKPAIRSVVMAQSGM